MTTSPPDGAGHRAAPRCSPDALAALPAAAPLLAPDGRVSAPLCVVDLDARCTDPEGAARAARRTDRVLLGVTSRPDPGPAPLVEALDLTLAPAGGAGSPPVAMEVGGTEVGGAEVGGRAVVGVADVAATTATITAAVAARPATAVLLARLLRRTADLPVPDALEVESLAYSTLLAGAEFADWLARRGPGPLPPPTTDPVLVARDGDRVRITLNRPERRNAYGRELRDALVAALDIARWDPEVSVVLDGAGPGFCSGGDLGEFGSASDPVTAHLVRMAAGAGLPLHRIADRVEVRLHGACIGAGIELAAFAGRVVAAADTRIRLPELAMGLVPGAGGTVSIPRRIGRWRTFLLAVTGEEIGAATALAWGLVDEVHQERPTAHPT